MNTVTWLHPAPYSPLPFSHPARAYTKAEDTNVGRTIERHAPINYQPDDYDRVTRDDWLSAPGGFK